MKNVGDIFGLMPEVVRVIKVKIVFFTSSINERIVGERKIDLARYAAEI